jgi:hypothetical protein
MKRVLKGLGWPLLVAAVVVVTVESASAQMLPNHPWTDRGFVNINMGFQPVSREARAEGSQPLYGENATFEAQIRVSNAPIFDISGGWRVWKNLAAGLAVARYHDSSDSLLSASIPDPLFFDRPHQRAAVVTGLGHSETAVHLSAVWVMPFTDKIDVSISVGPSIITVRKDVVRDISVPNGGTTIGSVSSGAVSKTVVGGHIAFDAQYVLLEDFWMFKTVGAGLFFRYGAASVEFEELAGSLTVGGLNYGLGARLRF